MFADSTPRLGWSPILAPAPCPRCDPQPLGVITKSMFAVSPSALDLSGVQTLYIEPGSPWENAYSESFNSRFEDELLNREIFSSLTEAKVLVEQYRLAYNHERPHSALGYRTPAEFAAEQASGRQGNVASAPDGATAFDLPQSEEELDLTMEPVLS